MGVRINNQSYKLAKVKTSTKDKADKKKIKSLKKTIKKALKANKYDAKTVGKYYKEMLDVEESSNTKYNIAICYLAIGNLTKAKEYFDASGNTGALIIDEQFKVRNLLKNFGVEIIENEF